MEQKKWIVISNSEKYDIEHPFEMFEKAENQTIRWGIPKTSLGALACGDIVYLYSSPEKALILIGQVQEVNRNNKEKMYFYMKLIKKIQPQVPLAFLKEAGIVNEKDKMQNNREITTHHSSLINRYGSPLNQILYGSPGTGKTYNTIDKTLCILGEIPESLTRQECKQLFDNYIQKEQVEFITFHQSYSYEEFIEGIKPKLSDNKTNELDYKIKEGVFKTLCERAQKPEFENQDMLQKLEKAYKDYTAKLYKHPFSLLSTNYIDERPTLTNINELIQNGKPIKQAKTQSDGANFYAMTDTSNSIRVLANTEKPSPMPLTYNEFIGSYCLGEKGTRFSYYSIFDEILEEANLDKDEIKQALSKQISNTKPYILIIDEINRGNVSKIFGELITLIEPSKRIGADEELRVTLPYSGSQAEDGETRELFGIPSNLYIIGTMNTADRSITSLDTALRRRFEFVEMMPDPTKLKNKGFEGIELDKLLQAINERIEFLYDREKTIGHAYLLDVKNLDDLKEAFQNKIIPLLQEYFYNDYEAIQAVLNNNGMIEINVDSNKQEKSKYIFKGAFKDFINDRGLDEKRIFRIAPKDSLNENNENLWDDPQTYINIYEG